jgi:hypothetical protein
VFSDLLGNGGFTLSGITNPHPALRATFSRWEKEIRRRYACPCSSNFPNYS